MELRLVGDDEDEEDEGEEGELCRTWRSSTGLVGRGHALDLGDAV